MPITLGINRTSNASICLMDGPRISGFVRKERVTRKKHAWGRLGDIESYMAALGGLPRQIDLIVECFSSDPQRLLAEAYRAELRHYVDLQAHSVVEISHHFSHAISAYYPSGFDRAVVLVIDNRGSPESLIGDDPLVVPGLGSGRVEVISAFAAEGSRITRIASQMWDESPTSLAGLGAFYSAASQVVLGRENTEGILMGLAAFGDPAKLNMPPLNVDGISVRVPEAWMTLFQHADRFSFLRTGHGQFADCADLAAATQWAFEQAVVKIARHLATLTGIPNLIMVGGCALNCAANAQVLADGAFANLFVPPACDDGGSAIGCAMYGQLQLGQNLSSMSWASDYLGPAHDLGPARVRELAAKYGLEIREPADLAGSLAKDLASGNVLALFQGRSESGPRALGNRSILADPRYEATRTYINRAVKGRAWFRPLAPVVPEELARRYFVLDRPSPHMLRKCDVRQEWRARLGAICHVDGSARVQTTTPETNPFLHSLLTAFGNETGLPILLNTSFNGKNEPIVETLEDAINSYMGMPLDMLVVPPFVISGGHRPRTLAG